MDILYEQITDGYVVDHEFAIYVFHGVYDISLKGKDKESLWESVSEEYINELLHAAMSGPSACNKRPWDFYVVTNEEILDKLKSTTRFTGMTAKLAINSCLLTSFLSVILRRNQRRETNMRKNEYIM